jgi:lipopolysaccharide/colanic/teichoic acid biosynthesis glycosyltransferase
MYQNRRVLIEFPAQTATRIRLVANARSNSAAGVAPLPLFESLLQRERELADRGTRRFSLLTLRARAVTLLPDLERELLARLRSTDVVGRLDAQRLGVLLTDTEAGGAQIVARWTVQCATRLGFELEPEICVYPDRGPRDEERFEFAPQVDLAPLVEVPTPFSKRCLDILVSGLALVLLLPLFALLALAIRLDSPGPLVFRQLRAGRGGRPFVFYKFRSMFVDAEARRTALAGRNEQEGPIFKMRADPRVTRVGRWLRRWSLDELPQLWNVLKGDMSLVGPRPPLLDEVARYERWQRRRLCVAGGLTCTWQVSGRSQIPFREWMRMDLRYVACRNLWLDLRLLLRTLPAVMSGRGAY